MGRHLAVGANSFARKWFVPVGRANKFAPTRYYRNQRELEK